MSLATLSLEQSEFDGASTVGVTGRMNDRNRHAALLLPSDELPFVSDATRRSLNNDVVEGAGDARILEEVQNATISELPGKGNSQGATQR